MGLLITVEGGEYTGKTSVVVPAIADYLKQNGIPVLVSREPGGTKQAEQMRKVIFQKMAGGAPVEELALLFMKARRLHLKEKIIPFLGKHREKRAVVLLDRYLDSTRVYQGLEGSVPLTKIKAMEAKYVGDYYPDLTLIMYFPDRLFDTVLAERMQQKREKTAWDNHDLDRHRTRQRHYLQLPDLAKNWGEARSFALIDASQSKEKVTSAAIAACRPFVAKQFDLQKG